MKTLFINPNTHLIRAGWRITLFIILFALLNVALMVGTRSLIGSLPALGTLWFFLLGTAATIATFITTKYICRQSISSLGLKLKYAGKDLAAGIVISAVIMSCMYGLLLILGLIQFDGFSYWQGENHSLGNFTMGGLWTMLAILFQFMVVAWWEELVFRGIFLQNIARGLNINWGILISTVAFGLIHAMNPNATVLSTLLIMVITFKLVYAYFKSGQLWLAIGLHLGWNFFQASIFGFASSGHYSPSLIAQSPASADWLSGGAFGAENSIFIAPMIILAFYLIHIWVKRSRALKEDHGMKDFLIKNKDFKAENYLG